MIMSNGNDYMGCVVGFFMDKIWKTYQRLRIRCVNSSPVSNGSPLLILEKFGGGNSTRNSVVKMHFNAKLLLALCKEALDDGPHYMSTITSMYKHETLNEAEEYLNVLLWNVDM
jgi:hypothetical protein